MARRVLTHDERAKLEKDILKDIGEALTEYNDGEEYGYSFDPEKGVIVAEKYSALGNVIEFYEVRPVVNYVGDGQYTAEEESSRR